MKLLALDAATEACSAALYVDGALRERFEIAPRQHTSLLLPMAHELLVEAGLKLTDLDALAFGQGPGSFTGIRIALGAIQGLALGLNRPVVGVSTLAALAQRPMRLASATQVAAAIDARMNQVYWGIYQRDAKGYAVAVQPDALYDPLQVPRLGTGEWQAVGTGWGRHCDALMHASGLQSVTPDTQACPHAEDIAWLAVPIAEHGGGVPASLAQPVYLRQQVAEKMKRVDP